MVKPKLGKEKEQNTKEEHINLFQCPGLHPLT
jgi:hypothetical protein